LESGSGGNEGRSWEGLASYFLGVDGSVYLLIEVFQ
jgi:hypothetical protein